MIGGRKTILQQYPVLPSALPNKIVTEGARYGALPENLQQQITFSFSRDLLGFPNDPQTLPWPRLNNQKLTLSFKPAAPDDEAALQSLLPEGEIVSPHQVDTVTYDFARMMDKAKQASCSGFGDAMIAGMG